MIFGYTKYKSISERTFFYYYFKRENILHLASLYTIILLQ